MDLGHLDPFTGRFRRARRTEDLVDDLPDQLFRNADHFSDLSFDDFAPNSRIRQGVKIRGNNSREIEPGTVYNERGIPAAKRDPRMSSHFMDINPKLLGFRRGGFHTNQADLPSPQGPFLDEEDMRRRYREGRSSAMDVGDSWGRPGRVIPYEGECHYSTACSQRQRRPETQWTVPPSPAQRFAEQSYANPRIQQQYVRSPSGRLSRFTDEYGNGRLRLGATEQRPGALPFGKAMKWLHEELGNAVALYDRFQEEYDGEIANIKEYASPEVLDQLWAMRVKGKRDRQDSSGMYDETEPIEKWWKKFVEQRRSVVEAIRAAQNASLSYGIGNSTKATILDARKRLQQKVDTASDHVVSLLDLAMQTRANCQALRGEVVLLTTLVDPNSDQNKSVYSEENSEDTGDGQAYVGGSRNYGNGDDAEYVENGNDEQQDDDLNRT